MVAFPEPADSTEPRPGIVDRLVAMIRVETVSAELDTRGTAAFAAFERLLAELYPLLHSQLDRERVEPFGLVFHWPGRTDADPVVLMAHWDVVPVSGQEWSVEPFAGRVLDDVVWGRGTLDDKGSVCALLDAFENLLAEGFTPARSVHLCLGGDEEVYGSSAAAIARGFHDSGVVPWLVLDEGGAVTEVPFPGVDGMFAMVGLGEKGVMTAELTTTGEGGHASAPPRLTAVTRLGRAVGRLARNPFAPRLPRAFRQTLATLARHAAGPAGPMLALAARLPWLAARLLAAAGGETAAIVRTTVAPTMLAGGSAPNVLPASASARVNLRLNLGETVEQARRRLQRALGDAEVGVRVIEGYDPTPESPTDNAQFALIAAAVEASYPGVPTVPYVTMAATDARHWHRFSPAVYRFSPLAMTSAQRACIHGADERLAVDSLRRGERFFRALLKALP